MTRSFISTVLIILSLSAQAACSTDQRQYTVMTYNVLYGAGVDAKEAQYAERSSGGKHRGNRLERVISVIKFVNPDIVGIQEACSWDKDNESAAKQVARELGMDYYLAKSTRSRFNVAIFSKLPIISAKDFPDQFSRAALEAEIKLPDGRVLHAFVAHFNLARDMNSQLSEIRYLAPQMRPYAFDLGVFLADANFTYGKRKESSEALRASGFLIAPFAQAIDQIWTSRPLSGGIKPGPKVPSDLTNGTSDHRPAAAIITIPAP